MAKLCKCGCNTEIPDTNTWVRGHQLKRNKADLVKYPRYDTPGIKRYCACGCGEEITDPRVEKWRAGHQLRIAARAKYLAPVAKLKVHIYPSFGDADNGDGGIRRVVEAQLKHLPNFGIEIVSTAEEADVIACHIEIPATYVRLYPHKPMVAMCHGLYWAEYEWPEWALKANAKVLEGIRTADAVIACSEWVGTAIRRHTSRPAVVIPHGIDMEEWEAEAVRDYVLWNKTRPDPICDPKPMNEVAELLPDVKFISTYGEEAPNVAITGKLPFVDAKKLIQNAGVYLCNVRETFGVGTLEALACGVPVVGYRWGGQAEFIEHGVDGWLVSPGDIEGLAEGIRWAFEHRSELAPACKAKAAQYSWENSAQMYANVFKKAYLDNKDNKEKHPRTSIIVTNYNLHKYLDDCLKSVILQTDHNWECIVVDDGSTDKTGVKIAQAYKDIDERFVVLARERNSYLAEARNIAIRQARGKYILPLDADDMLDLDAVKELADQLDMDKSIHVAYGGVKFVDEDGITPTDYKNEKGPGYSGWPMPFHFEYQIKQRNLLPYASMYRREAWENTGGYRRRCKTAEDADFWTRLSSYGYRPKMVTEKDTLIYRNREGSMSRTNSADWIDWFPWSKYPELTPAGAVTSKQIPVPSLEPIAISVIIPVGPGHGKLVTDAIDSVDAQSFRNWECIVINDTDIPIPSEFPSWARVFSTDGSSRGPANARNLGISKAKGKLFLPLDADDYLEPDALRMMFEAFTIQGDVIYSDFWQSDDKGKNFTVHECDDYDPELLTGKKRQHNGVVREGMIHSVTALTPVQAWKDVGGYDESLPGWEDWDFQLAIADKGYCSRRVATPLFFYRKHTGMRREENYAYFDKCKSAILKKWGRLWEGEKLMACGSCSQTRSVAYQSIPSANLPPSQANNMSDDQVVLIKCISNRMGGIPYRGPSKTTYWFASGDVKYVLRQDMDIFLSRTYEFQIVDSSNTPQAEPGLVATGQA